MNGVSDYKSRIQGIERNFQGRDYAIAAGECMKLFEQALRHVVRQYRDRVDETVRRDLQKATQKRGKQGDIEKLTMGQLIHVLEESNFLRAWAQTAGKDLSCLQLIDLKQLNQLRNQFTHNLRNATRTETGLLMKNLYLMLETFDIMSTEEIQNTVQSTKEPETSSPPQKETSGPAYHGNINVKGDFFGAASGNAQVTTGSRIDGDHAQQWLNAINPQSSREDIRQLLTMIQQELDQVDLPEETKEEVVVEVKSAEVQLKKEPLNKEKMADRLKNAAAALKETGNVTKEAVTIGNLIGKAITWCGVQWIKWMI